MSHPDKQSLRLPVHWLVLAAALAALAALIGLDRYHAYRAVEDLEREQLVRQAEIVDANVGRRLQTTANALDSMRNRMPRLSAQQNGNALAILDLEYFRLLMQTVLYAPDMRAELIHGDGKVVLQVPDPEGIAGAELSPSLHVLFDRHIRNGLDTSVSGGLSGPRGDSRLVVFRSIGPTSSPADKPLVIAISGDAS